MSASLSRLFAVSSYQANDAVPGISSVSARFVRARRYSCLAASRYLEQYVD